MCIFFFLFIADAPFFSIQICFTSFRAFFFWSRVSNGEHECVCKLNITIKTDRCDLCQSESGSYFYSQSQWIYCMRFSSPCKHSLDKRTQHQQHEKKNIFVFLVFCCVFIEHVQFLHFVVHLHQTEDMKHEFRFG